jgi:hypothetical protein
MKVADGTRLARRPASNHDALSAAGWRGSGVRGRYFCQLYVERQGLAFWIGHELEAFGHKPRIHEWELSGGANIMAWMTAQTDTAAHVLCVVSERYLKASYSSLERQAAEWAA